MPRSAAPGPSPLDPAQVALTSAKRHADERKEKKIDKVFEAFQSPEVSAVKDVTLQVYSALKSQIGTFVQSSEGLMRVLDEVGKLHPFIQVAVIPFKAALALELKRLDNDKKVLALFVQMGDMMSNLRLLETISPGELGKEGIKIADRMDEQLKKAASAIQECSHITHDYYKSKFIVKLLKCNSWEDKFTEFTSTFVDLASDFDSILALYTGVGIQTIHRITERLDGKLDILMKLIFETLVTPEEQELTSFIDAKGGVDKFVDSDDLLQELIRKREAQVSRSGAPGSESNSPSVSRKTTKSTNFSDIKTQLKGSLDKSLAESKAFFNQKFEEQKNQLSEVKVVVRRESDRIIHEIMSGPKDRILDKAMHAMWVEMGWKGSAKSRHVVLAIRDFYTDQLLHATKDTKDPESALVQTPVTETHWEEKHAKTRGLLSDLPALTEDDIWAIGRINNFRLRPLQEALDPDCSDFVTIHELNEFTSARPSDWSLPLWLAYWTSGFEVTLRQYTFRIRSVLYDISSIYRSLVPGNAGVFSRLTLSYAMYDIDLIVAGTHTFSLDDLEEEYPHSKFREYAAEIEKRVEKRWKSLDYFIDEQNTLSLVIGDGYLEEYALPLVYLILRRILSILEEGKTRSLTDADFRKPLGSLETLRSAIHDRTVFLKGIFKLRNLALNEEIRRYCYALYYYFAVANAMDELDTEKSYFSMPDGYYDVPISDLNSEAEEEPSKDAGLEADVEEKDDDQSLVYQEDEDDIESALKVSAELETSITDQSLTGLVGVWHGFYYYGFYSSDTDGVMGFRIDSINEDNTFVGGGSDSLSGFTIKGKLNGRRISFLKEYDRLISRSKLIWFYSGKINSSFDAITGKWGDPSLAQAENGQANGDNNNEDDEDDDPENSETDGEDFLGRFTVQKKSAEFVRFRPLDKEFEENKPHALWKFALNAVMDSVSRRILTWSTLKKRRDDRRRFIYLWSEYQEHGLQDREDSEDFQMLQRQLSAVDLRLYRHLAQVSRSRTVQHQASCDSCFKFPILMTRYLCLICSVGHYYNTVDICGDCVDKQFTVFRNNRKQELTHVSSHTLLQIRRPFAVRDNYRTREIAKSTLDYAPSAAEELSGITCGICKESIKERPYWSCCVCYALYVCKACNLKVERDQPWLYEVKTVQDKSADDSEEHDDDTNQSEETSNPHHWSHDLVLVTNPEPPRKSLSVEERLTNLEERFERQNKVMEGIQESVGETRKQLQRLENMLQQLIKVPQK